MHARAYALRMRPLILAAFVVACSAARSRVADLDPVMPPRADCTPGAWACRDGVPSQCARDEADSNVTRWRPTVPRRADGTVAACARCVVDTVAHCAAVTP